LTSASPSLHAAPLPPLPPRLRPTPRAGARVTTIAFDTGMEFGYAHDDLFVYDVASNRLRALTADGSKHLQRLARFRGADAITFAAGRAGVGNPTGRLFEVPVGGGTPKKIADVGAALNAYAWDRKGRRAALMTEDARGIPSSDPHTRNGSRPAGS
jgi:hypothetical protein